MLLIWGTGDGSSLMYHTFILTRGDLERDKVRKIGLRSWLGLLSSSRSSLIGESCFYCFFSSVLDQKRS